MSYKGKSQAGPIEVIGGNLCMFGPGLDIFRSLTIERNDGGT